MKKQQIKLSLLMAGLLSGLSMTVHAQALPKPIISAPEEVKAGNAFERELTPLLREISRKKSQLELRKLDRELEKIDEEALKAQLEMDGSKNNSTQPGNGSPVYDAFATIPSALPTSQVPPPNTIGSVSPSDIKVLMIYGFDDKLNAKIAAGQQGGYVVKKGDVMPDGQIVSNITSNYIEVKKDSNLKSDVKRIFVSSSSIAESKDGVDLGGTTGSALALPALALPAQALPAQAKANETAIATMMAPIPSQGQSVTNKK